MLLHLTPDLALLTATLGLCLLVLECNRPGLILPATLGLLLTLLATAALLHHPVTLWAAALLLAATITLALNLYRFVPIPLLAGATLGLILSFRFLLKDSSVHTPTALVCGSVLGILTASLSRIAYRARRAKAVH